MDKLTARGLDAAGLADGKYVLQVTGGKAELWTPDTGMADPTTTKGDIIVRGASGVARLPLGDDGQVVTADSSQPLGVKWAAGGGGGGVTTNYPPGSADKPPSSPNAKDDEFDGSSTVTWTNTPTAATATDIGSTRSSHLRIYRASGGADAYFGLYQAVPATYPYTITTKVSGTTMRANYNRGGGIILGPAAPTSTSALLYSGPVFNNSTGAGGLAYGPIGERILTKFDGTFTSQTSPFPVGAGPYYVRVKVNSATSVDTYLSSDGWAWVPWELAFNPGFTPGVMGLAVSAIPASGGLEAYFDFFRVT